MIVESVNVGGITGVSWGRIKSSAIDNRPVDGRRAVGLLGFEGDEIADLKHHGGLDQAVYAFAGEQLDHWAAELGHDLPAGSFGENLTTRGLDVEDARIGDRWRIGTALLEVSGVRTPCMKFQFHIGQSHWVKRFTQHGRPGAYLRVVEAGEIGAGDTIEIAERRPHDLTVARAFRALTTERHLLPELATEPRCGRAIVKQLGKATVN